MTFHEAPRRVALLGWMAAAAAAAAPDTGFAQSATQSAPAPSASQPAPASGSQASGASGTKVKQVTVTASRTDRVRSSPDSRSYDITHDPQGATGAVADVLRNVPSVEVDPDGKVSLRGDSNVVIYVDGKPSSLFKGQGAGQALQSIPADQFERVEVMTNPSAAYSPDGAAGIINLVTKKNHKPGRWGSVKVAEGSGGRWNGSVTASQRGDKLALNFGAGVRHDQGGADGGGSRETLDGSGAVVSTLKNANRNHHVGDSAWAYGSAEWNPDAKTQLTASLNGWDYRGRYSGDTRLETDNPAGVATQLMERDGGGRYEGSGFSGGLTYRRTFESDAHNLVVSLTHDGGNNANTTVTTQTNLTPAAPDSFDDLRRGDARPQTEFKVDYTRPMPLEATLKAGVDIRDEADRADNSGFLAAASLGAPNDPGQTDLFRFDRRISAAYATYNQPIGRLTVLAGLRVEDTKINLDDETTKFSGQVRDTRLYPTLHLGWKLTERQQLRASYSERVQRPGADQYDPFRFTWGPYSQSQGNPDLKPEESRKYELAYEYKAGSSFYAATAYYKHSDGGVAYVTTNMGNGVFLSSPDNLSRSQNGGLELIASGRLFKSLNFNLSENTYWNEIDASALGYTPQSGWTWSSHGSVDWQATPKDLLQIQANLSGPHLTPQGYNEGGPFVNLGYRHKFDDRLAMQVTANDPFGQSYSRFVSDAPTFHDAGRTEYHNRAAYLTLIWNFGRGHKRDESIDYGSPAPGGGPSPS